jgi:hypothetical protein
MIARLKLWLALRKRKAIRKVEGERVKQGKLAAQRKAWANDPMRAV